MSRAKTAPCIVYAIQCTKNKKVYVGLTQRFEERIKAHFSELEHEKKTLYFNNRRVPSRWQKDYNEYGKAAFRVYILEENIQPELANSREKYWIKYYDSTDWRFGYNINRGECNPYNIDITPGKPERIAIGGTRCRN